jgi:hypothetical protein
MKQLIKTAIREFLNENTGEKYKEEYFNYHGDMIGFDEKWNNLTKNDFNKGGLLNIPEYVELSRLVNVLGEFKKNKNIHWVRTSDEHLFYDKDWLFLTDIKIDDNTKIIRIKTHKSNINIEQTIIQNLTFDYEREITLKNVNLKEYEIVNY